MEFEFQWDEGNGQKNFVRHGITREESEQVFFNPYVLKPDKIHSSREDRFHLIGKTDAGKILFMSFTIRNNKIRIISAQPRIKKKGKLMKKLKKTPIFKNEDREKAFRDNHSSMDYIDWSKAKKGIFFNVKPTTRTISIRMPAITLAQLKLSGQAYGCAVQSLIKQYVETALGK